MSAVFPLARYKFSAEDYHRMGEAGVLAPDSRIEPIEGEVLHKASPGSVYASVVSVLYRFFAHNVGDEAGWVSSQSPVRLLSVAPQFVATPALNLAQVWPA